MQLCHTLPSKPLARLWLMTDERMGDGLLPSLEALPKGSGVIFRHYSLAAKSRRRLFEAVRLIAKKHRLTLILAGSPKAARAWRAAGAHGKQFGTISAPVHSIPERIAAERAGVRIILLSPAFSTNSHKGKASLGRVRFGQIAHGARVPVIALGGMTHKRARSLSAFGIYGWAAIDGLTRQKPAA